MLIHRAVTRPQCRWIQRSRWLALLAVIATLLGTGCEAEPSPRPTYRPEIVGLITATESITGGHRVTLDNGRTYTVRTGYERVYSTIGEGRLLLTDASLSWIATARPEADCFVISGGGRQVGDTLVLNSGLVLRLAESYEVGGVSPQERGGVRICLNADGEVIRLTR